MSSIDKREENSNKITNALEKRTYNSLVIVHKKESVCGFADYFIILELSYQSSHKKRMGAGGGSDCRQDAVKSAIHRKNSLTF